MMFSSVGPQAHRVTSHTVFAWTTLRIHQDCMSGELEFSTWFWSGKLQGEYVELERSLHLFCKLYSNTGVLFPMSWAFFFLFMKPTSFLNVLYRYHFLSEMLYQQWVIRHIVITFSFQMKHSKIIWEGSLVGGTSLLDWPAGVVWVNGLVDVGRTSPLWVTPFPRRGFLPSIRVERSSWAHCLWCDLLQVPAFRSPQINCILNCKNKTFSHCHFLSQQQKWNQVAPSLLCHLCFSCIRLLLPFKQCLANISLCQNEDHELRKNQTCKPCMLTLAITNVLIWVVKPWQFQNVFQQNTYHSHCTDEFCPEGQQSRIPCPCSSLVITQNLIGKAELTFKKSPRSPRQGRVWEVLLWRPLCDSFSSIQEPYQWTHLEPTSQLLDHAPVKHDHGFPCHMAPQELMVATVWAPSLSLLLVGFWYRCLSICSSMWGQTTFPIPDYELSSPRAHIP